MIQDTSSETIKNKITDYEEKVTIQDREKDQIMYQRVKLAAMDKIIGDIAHQWRQPLNSLTLLIQSFGTKSLTGNLYQEFIDTQVDEGLRLADQMSNIIEGFKNFNDSNTYEKRVKNKIISQNSKSIAMDEMIGDIAHQWRQPLNALTLLIQSFGTKSMTGNLTQEFIDKQVIEGLRLANQMSNTIENFRNFFSPHREREYFSLKKSLSDTLELVKFFCKDEYIDIKIIAKEDLRVFGYSNEFAQVILNFIYNARDNFKQKSINDSRRIIIELERKHKQEQKQETFVKISFIDNGGGIDPKIKDRIFEPYFTTKHKSTGTGIGLYMSKQIIEKQMHGFITTKNIEHKMGGDKVYKCAQFIIAIPIK